jgi:DNA-binding transcriptional regulator LsrR (DeoR family)
MKALKLVEGPNHHRNGDGAHHISEMMPLWKLQSTAKDDPIVRCAKAYAEAFKKHPLEPRLKQITAEARCSRNHVKPNLETAVRLRYLRLIVNYPKDGELSNSLAQAYGLKEAVVTTAPADWNDQESVRTAVAPTILTYLEQVVACFHQADPTRRLVRIGVDGGQMLFQALHQGELVDLPPANYEIVPLGFGPLAEPQYAAGVIANLLAIRIEMVHRKASVKDAFTIRADWQQGRNDYRRSFSVERQASPTADVDLLVVGIGSRKAGQLHRELQRAPNRRLHTSQHFGDICNLAFNRNGDAVTSMVRNRASLLNLHKLRTMAANADKLVIGSAGGRDKVDAIRTVLRNKYISVLVTDRETAIALLQ